MQDSQQPQKLHSLLFQTQQLSEQKAKILHMRLKQINSPTLLYNLANNFDSDKAIHLFNQINEEKYRKTQINPFQGQVSNFQQQKSNLQIQIQRLNSQIALFKEQQQKAAKARSFSANKILELEEELVSLKMEKIMGRKGKKETEFKLAIERRQNERGQKIIGFRKDYLEIVQYLQNKIKMERQKIDESMSRIKKVTAENKQINQSIEQCENLRTKISNKQQQKLHLINELNTKKQHILSIQNSLNENVQNLFDEQCQQILRDLLPIKEKYKQIFNEIKLNLIQLTEEEDMNKIIQIINSIDDEPEE